MKKIFFGFIAIAFVSCNSTTYSSYGLEITDKESHSYESVFNKAQNGEVTDVTIQGEITQTCAKKGCWMDVKVSDTDTVMVRFKEYGFFVPKEGVEGKTTFIRGNAKMDTISVDMLRHYAEDAGESEEEILKITEPRFVLEFIADGVLIQE